ncbi:polysaccharide pyruvyl transferase [Christiangramia gaetbulicola]|uniref:Polysaccharide pyruvyl transferase n=1 Tax=Christiangramia gaetbulicola TaxID=703340 RepID=A0A2T6AJV1_9FLAO|nr:polysaccharide pyruvyl transferase family protein [Christiangramia gaetbulicola]PTX44092.1 polysaccharide pyruvyl transferase [Christiangramia gaetbulicola]
MPFRKLPVFYWSEIKFLSKKKENYGDLVSKYLIEKISGKNTEWIHPKKQPWYRLNKVVYLGAGSIIHHATKHSIVWGSGIIDNKQEIQEAKFLAVRGPQTMGFLHQKGYSCPEVYGDPALLLPKFYFPDIEKSYKIGIIPHYHDYDLVNSWYKDSEEIIVIDLMTLDVEEVTRKIIACKQTISSSLHGIIVSHAYNIPSVWVRFSKKIFGNNIKYQDYMESVQLPFYSGKMINEKISDSEIESMIQEKPNLPYPELIKSLQDGLMHSCPFTV